MPGEIDGIALAECAKKSLPRLPIVLMSGYEDPPPYAPKCAFVKKPFTLEALLKAIWAALTAEDLSTVGTPGK